MFILRFATDVVQSMSKKFLKSVCRIVGHAYEQDLNMAWTFECVRCNKKIELGFKSRLDVMYPDYGE